MASNATIDTLEHAWKQFSALAAQADGETKDYGSPGLSTTAALDKLHYKLLELEQDAKRDNSPGTLFASLAPRTVQFALNGETVEYSKGTYEHYRFVKALRHGTRGMSEQERELVRYVDDAWLALREKELGDAKAMTLANDITGGYLASNEFANDVLHQLVNASPARQVARVRPIGAATGLIQPVRTSLPVAVHVSEGATGRFDTSADVNYGQQSIPVHEIMVPVLVSRHLLNDASYPIDVELAQAFSDAAAVIEGKELILGSGSGEMLGLDSANLPAANKPTCADNTGHLVKLDDVAKLIFQSGFKAAYLPQAKLLMNPKLYGTLLMEKGSSTAPGYMVAPNAPQSLFGIPVVFAPEMPDNATPAAGKNVAYLLHPSGYQMAIRNELVVQRLDQTYAEKGLIAFYLFSRFGGQPVLPEAIGRLVTA